MKYPIGIQDFGKIRKDGYVYVDKTDLLYKMVKEGTIYFLSRPRRFGKSLLVSTLKHYFLGHKELFSGLAIDALEKDWAEHPVFLIDFNGLNFADSQALTNALEGFVSSGERKYDSVADDDSLGSRFAAVIKAAHEKTGHRCVVLIDEYDKPLLDVMDLDMYTTDRDGNRISLEDNHRNILKGFYSVFKKADQDLQFVLLTGVTKFSQVSVFSGFNQPEDISMESSYESLCGITKEELLSVFDEQIRDLSAALHIDVEETIERLKNKYDGYHFGEEMVDVFNPFSLLNCFKKKKFGDYWFASGTPTYLVRLLSHSNENINELVGKYYDASQFINYKADVEMPLPMIYQSGYLTIKDFDVDTNSYMLDFPNDEVRTGFIDVLSAGYFKDPSNNPKSWVLDVNRDLREGDAETFIKKMTVLLSSVSYRFKQKDNPMECERHFHYTFYLIMQMLGHYNTLVEKETSEGRIDCVLEYPNYVYVIEFKKDGSAKDAVNQIKEKGYLKPYLTEKREVKAIGINFSTKTGTIDDKSVKTLKEVIDEE